MADNYNYDENQDQNNNENDFYARKKTISVPTNNRAWSIASLVCGILSIVCCCILWLPLVFAVLAIVFAVLARKSMGYFDGLALAGLICGIVGAVLALANGITDIVWGPQIEQYLNEWMAQNGIQ